MGRDSRVVGNYGGRGGRGHCGTGRYAPVSLCPRVRVIPAKAGTYLFSMRARGRYGMNGAFVSPPITVDGRAASSSSSVHGAAFPASR